MGINYAYISSDITKEEIRDIKLNTKSKLFITAYGYVPIFYSRRYLLNNYFEYIDKSYKKDVFYLDNEYPIKESDFGTIIYSNKITNIKNVSLIYDTFLRFILTTIFYLLNIY